MNISIEQIRESASRLCTKGCTIGLSAEERKDLALLVCIIRKYDGGGA